MSVASDNATKDMVKAWVCLAPTRLAVDVQDLTIGDARKLLNHLDHHRGNLQEEIADVDIVRKAIKDALLGQSKPAVSVKR